MKSESDASISVAIFTSSPFKYMEISGYPDTPSAPIPSEYVLYTSSIVMSPFAKVSRISPAGKIEQVAGMPS